MSSDPFHQNSPQQYGNDGGFSGNNPPPPKGRNWFLILGVVFGLGFLGLIICCGLMTFGFTKFGSVVFEPVRGELNQSAQVQEKVGNVEKLTMNFGATVKEAEDNADFVILDAETSQGPFQFSVKMGAAGEVEEAFLIAPDGSRQELNMSAGGISADQPTTESKLDFDTDSEPVPENETQTEKELRELESALELN